MCIEIGISHHFATSTTVNLTSILLLCFSTSYSLCVMIVFWQNTFGYSNQMHANIASMLQQKMDFEQAEQEDPSHLFRVQKYGVVQPILLGKILILYSFAGVFNLSFVLQPCKNSKMKDTVYSISRVTMYCRGTKKKALLFNNKQGEN